MPKRVEIPKLGEQPLVRYRPKAKPTVVATPVAEKPRRTKRVSAKPSSAPLAVVEHAELELIPPRLVPAPLGDPSRNPVAVYLARLRTAKSRRAMVGALARVLRAGGMCPEKGAAAARRVLAHPWATWRYAEVVAARAALSSPTAKLSPATINQALAALRGVLREAFRLGLLDGEAWARVEDVDGIRSSRLPTGRCLAPDELDRLFAAAREVRGRRHGEARAARDVAILAVLRLGGCRLAELAGLQLEGVDLERGEARVVGKGDKERVVFFADALADLRAWVAHRGTQPGPLYYSFNPTHEGRLDPLTEGGVYYVVKEVAARAGVSMTTHDFRRTFITDLLDAGADVVAVQKIVGHAQVTTTASYDRRDEARLRGVAAGVKLPKK